MTRTASQHRPVRGHTVRLTLEALERRELLTAVHEQYTARLYRDILHREAGPAEQANWAGFLDQGAPRPTAVKQILGSSEAHVITVVGLYSTLLQRPSDDAGLTNFMALLAAGRTVEQIQGFLVGSQEYFQNRGNGTNAGFLVALYADLLGRQIDGVGLAQFTQFLDGGGSRVQVAAVVLNTDEYRQVLVRGLYRTHLGRDADAGGLDGFVAALRGGARQEDVRAAMLGAAEFFVRTVDDRGVPNEQFVRQVYQDLLDRQGDTTGVAGWVSYLEPGGFRQLVATRFLGTNEYRARAVQAAHQDLLRRDTDGAGLTAFVNFLNSGGTVEQVQAVLAGSDEYFEDRGGGTTDGFLDALYDDALSRAISDEERAQFTELLDDGGTRSDVATAVYGTTEYREVVVDSFYRLYLRRDADASGLDGFVAALERGARREEIIAVLIGSVEYLAYATRSRKP